MPNIYKCTAIIIQLCISQFKVNQQEISQNKTNSMVITIYGNSKESHDQYLNSAQKMDHNGI
jgi:hypothetical protein